LGKNTQKDQKEMTWQKRMHKEQKNHLQNDKTRTNIMSKEWGEERNWYRRNMEKRVRPTCRIRSTTESKVIGFNHRYWYISVILADKEKCERENNQCTFPTWSAYIPAYNHNGFTINGREICWREPG
jgi:hypothetical protein